MAHDQKEIEMDEANEVTTPSKPDWLVYQRFFEVVGGVGGYLELRNNDRLMLNKLLEAFHIDLSESGDHP